MGGDPPSGGGFCRCDAGTRNGRGPYLWFKAASRSGQNVDHDVHEVL